MRVDVIKGFLPEADCIELNAWTEHAAKNGLLSTGLTRNGLTNNRLTSRLNSFKYVYPQLVIDTSNKVREFVGVSEYPLITGHGRDGVVVSYTTNGGDVYKHRDPSSQTDPNLGTLRCNILTQKPEAGGELYVEGRKIELEVGDLHCYMVSKYHHWATPVVGNTARIMWMFGAHVPEQAWEYNLISGDY